MFSFLVKSGLYLVFFGAIVGFVLFAKMYEEVELDAKELIEYHPKTSSAVYDRKGRLLAYIFDKKHHLHANFDEIPGVLIEALVAMEDTRFFEHDGINFEAILRAAIKDIQAGSFVEGGSTLTQQLVKNKVLSSQKKLSRKIKEAILSMKIENRLSKEQILERYLNEISYGNNYQGVKTASVGYFHKQLKALTLKEIAMLVALPNAPSFYNPLRHYNRLLNRANNVLFRMRSLGWITEQSYQAAIKEAPKVFHSSLTQNIAPMIVDEVKREFKGRFSHLLDGGYSIYTTIDWELQKAAVEAMNKTFQANIKRFKSKNIASELNGALVAIESKSGDILAMVGNVNSKQSHFNRATQSRRQPGSAFKPFIYQTAIDMGYNPATPLTDMRRVFEYTYRGKKRIWSPKNYERDFKGFITLREALVHSRNLATINLLDEIGIGTVRKRLALLNVKKIPKDMSIALGNLAISPVKMAQIYSVFANKGHMIEPRLVSKIVSREQAVIYETTPHQIADFTTPEQAYLMTDIMADVVRRGTGKNAKVEGLELAGKTGTTNDNVDGWFCGYSPEVETIVWFGRDDNKPIGKGATGGKVAAPAFAKFYQAYLKLYPKAKRFFDIPLGVFMGEYEGKEELFTKTSALPIKSAPASSATNSVDMIEDTLNQSYEDSYYDLLPQEQTHQQQSPLHPEVKSPKRSVSQDSGELF